MQTAHDEAELHAIEQELNIEILPGTEIMTDVGTHHFLKSSAGVLVPQPSADPHDPLNWSKKWKMLAITAVTSVTFVQGFGPLALAPAFPAYMAEWNRPLPDVVRFTGVSILVLGFSNFIWVPLSSSFGRRHVLIASNLICLASMIWRARAMSYGSFMGACVLNGIGAGPAETIQPAVVADIFFLHERGFWNTLYWVAYMGSLMVAPIISGAMTQALGWRPFWWLNVAIVAASTLLVVFAYPETKYERAHSAEMTPSDKQISPAASQEKDLANIEKTETAHSNAPQDLSLSATAARDPHLGKGTPSKSQWKIFQPNRNPGKTILLNIWVPWKLFAYPIVEFAAFVVSWSCSSFLTLNLTQSQAFAAPPYLIDPQNIGFMNFAILVGAMIGLATAGPFSDWVSKRLTLRNNGIREPEMRLVAMIPYVIIMYVGNIIVAVGYEKKWHWAIIVVLGYTAAGIQVAALPAIASTYAVDSYKPVAGPLFVAITVNKNLWGYGFAEFVNKWIAEVGFIPPIMTNASLILFFCLCGIPFYFFGKTFRRWSKNSSVHKMEEMN
ncbi:serine/threonine kinase 16 [Elsinoe ampelina]|uniref:Serine/threonine kinase 16 n=1 Tax=Elsinoe ampelina TaxID=302913 RepID=A0A6A6GPL5_9PEZI|nr:serine/threonine kinase 16 [Elsinoe ampelina]